MKHDLKIAPAYFDAVADGSKPFEVRFNDRNYKVGDVLLLREYVEEQGHYTGRTLERLVTYVLDNKNFCKEDLVILGLRPTTEAPTRVELLLRRLLAHRVAGHLGYYDDGELQDGTDTPSIDFLRDHPKDIELKLFERGKKARPPSPTLDMVTRQFEDAQAKNVRRRLLIEEVINLCAIGDIDEKTDDGIGWGSWVARAKVEVAR